MTVESKKYLFDIEQAAMQIATFTEGKSFDDYRSDAMMRSAVERQFEIVGEALSRLARIDEELTGKITEFQRIISFRNILIHGYAQVDDRLVWDVIHTKLPALRREVHELLGSS